MTAEAERLLRCGAAIPPLPVWASLLNVQRSLEDALIDWAGKAGLQILEDQLQESPETTASPGWENEPSLFADLEQFAKRQKMKEIYNAQTNSPKPGRRSPAQSPTQSPTPSPNQSRKQASKIPLAKSVHPRAVTANSKILGRSYSSSISLTPIARSESPTRAVGASGVDSPRNKGLGRSLVSLPLPRSSSSILEQWDPLASGSSSGRPPSPSRPNALRPRSITREQPVSEDEATWWVHMLSNWTHQFSDKKGRVRRALLRGVPDPVRGEVWKKLTEADGFLRKYPKQFGELQRQTSPHEAQIHDELQAVFPKHVFFKERGQQGSQALFNVLKGYSLHDKELGYHQSLGWVAVVLLVYLTDEEAFAVLVQLCRPDTRCGMVGRLLKTPHGLKRAAWLMDLFLAHYLPVLAAHFRSELLAPSMYIGEWFSTLFAYSLPFNYVHRLWDLFFWQGEKWLFRTALALLKLHEPELLHMKYDKILQKLKRFASLPVEPADLVRMAERFKDVTKKKIDKLDKELAKDAALAAVPPLSQLSSSSSLLASSSSLATSPASSSV